MGIVKEVDIQRACLQFLAAKQIFAWRNNSTGVYDPQRGVFRRTHSIKGVADILGILPDGRFLACEVKTPKGRVSEEQQQFLNDITDRGGVGMVVRSVDELEADLKEAGVLQ